MLFKLWELIQLLLPLKLLIKIYKNKKAIPTNIKTRSGRGFKAIMITNDIGILFSNEVYIGDRVKKLVQQKKFLDKASDEILDEINSLSFNSKQELYELMKSNEDEI